MYNYKPEPDKDAQIKKLKLELCCLRKSGNSCLPLSIKLKNFNGDTDLSYPLGVFSTTGTYLGIATNATEYITLWNADSNNQELGEILSGSGTVFTFQPIFANSIINLYGLEYFTVKGAANLRIHGSDGLIGVYGSTVVDFASTGTTTSSDSEFEWNGNATSGRYRHSPIFTFKKKTMTGLTNNSDLNIFHSRTSDTFGTEFSDGAYTISGILPKALRNFFFVGQNITDFNSVTNWADLDKLEWFFLDHAGGGPWRVEPTGLPTGINITSLKGVCIGEFAGNSLGYLTWMNSYVKNSTIMKQLEYYSNGGVNMVSQSNFVSSIPKFTELLNIRHASTAIATSTEVDNFLIALNTKLSGVIPTGQKLIKMNACSARTSASDAAYNALTTAGWTITIS